MAPERSLLRRKLDEKGIRASWFASFMSVKPPQLTHIATGRRRAADTWWYRAAGYLNCSVTEIRPEYSRPPEPRRLRPIAQPEQAAA